MDMRAVDVNALDTDLLETVVQIVRLLNIPDDARILMPLLTQEIVYRLLKSPQGPRLPHLALSGGYTPQIIKAVAWLRTEFDEPLWIDDLVHELGMSISGFHYHFKAVTALSPLQFQKQLRLQEARRLMISEDLDATSTAYRVGYNDASQFNREYKSANHLILSLYFNEVV